MTPASEQTNPPTNMSSTVAESGDKSSSSVQDEASLQAAAAEALSSAAVKAKVL